MNNEGNAGTYEAPPYAGGSHNVTHTDIGALSLLSRLGCKTLLDVGCGVGGQVKAAERVGFKAFGIDVDPVVLGPPNIALIDLCKAPVVFPEQFDVVWSVEVAEHIPPEYAGNYLDTVCNNAKRILVMTASQEEVPGHVNIKPPGWWMHRAEMRAMQFSPELTAMLRRFSTMTRDFMEKTGMVFVRMV
tara:strand:+ start:1390 stop:1953 length:564 start_codon:yes stop_codon:yes gene_type:complete